MRPFILAILGVFIIIGSFYAAKAIIASKKTPVLKSEKVIKMVFVDTVQNKNTPISIRANGNLIAKNRIELFSQVQGIFLNTGKEFKEGQRFKKGEVLIKLDRAEFYASVQSAKSNLYNIITSILPDLRLDFPKSYPKWNNYLKGFDLKRATPKLPQTLSEKEKYFITGRGVYTNYFNIKTLEERLSKYIIKAPYSGTLTQATVTEGTLVRNGQKLGEFIDTSVFELEVSIPAKYSKFLKVGKKINVDNIEDGVKYSAEVIRINASVDKSSQTVSTFVKMSGKGLREGMYLEVLIPLREEANSFSLSRTLLQYGDQVFYVENDTILNLAKVKTIFFSDENVVVKGIPDGTKIVSKPVPGAYNGMLVKIYQE